jgi:hypothetical protein
MGACNSYVCVCVCLCVCVCVCVFVCVCVNIIIKYDSEKQRPGWMGAIQ